MDLLDVINESVANFNRVFGVINNIEVVNRHWSTDSYPQSGNKPQELLNEQIVRNCDAAMAIFWTRFGTPTDKYGSGTEEEIEEMLAAGKQVFLYFLDKEISLSDVDIEQYKKVLEFREKYKDRGIYFVVKNEQELQQKLTNHLGLYFLPLIVGESKSSGSKNQVPILKIRDGSNLSNELFQVNQLALSNSKFIYSKKQKIIDEIEKLTESKLPARLPKREEAKVELTEFQKSLQNLSINQFGVQQDAEIGETYRETIQDFADHNSIVLGDGFWNLGELKQHKALVALPFGNGKTFEGSDPEKDRYKSLMNLYWEIKEYKEYMDYFTILDRKKYLKCVLSNMGTTFDEDLDIKLIFPSGFICIPNNLPIPGINIIEDINKGNWLNYFFTIGANENIDGYSGYPLDPPNYQDLLPSADLFNRRNASEEYEKDTRIYIRKVNNIFCYKIYNSDQNDIWCLHIQYLKHNTNMAFPSILLFDKLPQYLDYEISSKHTPDVLCGHIEVNNKASCQ